MRQRKGYCYLLDGYSVADISLDEDECLAFEEAAAVRDEIAAVKAQYGD